MGTEKTVTFVYDDHSIYTVNEGGKIDTKIWNRLTHFFSIINYSTVRDILIKDDIYHWVLCVQNHNLLGADKNCALADICFIVFWKGKQDLHEDEGFNPFFSNSNYRLPYYFMFFFFLTQCRRAFLEKITVRNLVRKNF